MYVSINYTLLRDDSSTPTSQELSCSIDLLKSVSEWGIGDIGSYLH